MPRRSLKLKSGESVNAHHVHEPDVQNVAAHTMFSSHVRINLERY